MNGMFEYIYEKTLIFKYLTNIKFILENNKYNITVRTGSSSESIYKPTPLPIVGW